MHATNTKTVKYACFSRAIPWHRPLVDRSLLRSPGLDLRSVHVIFVIDKVSMGQVFVQVLRFSLSVSFHFCSILIFIYTLLLQEGQRGEAWEPYKSNVLSAIGENWVEN